MSMRTKILIALCWIVVGIMWISALTSCSYDGFVTRVEYSHNYFKQQSKYSADVANTHVSVGPIFDLFGMDNLELMFAIGPEFREVNAELDSAILINPRLMWFFAPNSFLQIEYDLSIIPEEDQINHFFFVQFEKRF